MTAVVEVLLIAIAVAPLVGAISGAALVAFRLPKGAGTIANLGILVSGLAALASGILLYQLPVGSRIVARSLGAWFELTSRQLPIEWGLQIDPLTAIWITTTSGLAWFLAVVPQTDSDIHSSTKFSIATAFVMATTTGFVLATGLIQMLVCWNLIGISVLALVASDSRSHAATQGMRRALQAGLPGDLMLLWGLIWIVQSGFSSLPDVASQEGLERLGRLNPALPAVIGCLLVLGVFGRAGLFPVFGWHHESIEWNSRIRTVVYGIAFAPSALWMLLKCQALLRADVQAGVLGGLGALGAGVAAFVACGQESSCRRLAYLVTAQSGVILTGLASGHADAVGVGVFHLCSVALSAFLLFDSQDARERPDRRGGVANWCAILSLAGMFPLASGWSISNLVEMEIHPASVTSPGGEEMVEGESQTDAATNLISVSDEESARRLPSPRWGWICGVWITQGLTAFALAQVLKSSETSHRDFEGGQAARNRIWFASTHSLVAMLLFLLGPIGWLTGALHWPATSEAWIHLASGQAFAVVGLLTGWQFMPGTRSGQSSGSGNARPWDSLTRLSRERMHIDQAALVWSGPIAFLQWLARSACPQSLDRFFSQFAVRLAAWIGAHAESLQVEQTGFYLATILLGTLTFLLTLVLVT
jgi:formate hydrogenlyase subunit 3/multisubunit Na+/H+ antiporter MnhD subunit